MRQVQDKFAEIPALTPETGLLGHHGEVFRRSAVRPPRRATVMVVGVAAATAVALGACSSSGSKSAADTSTVIAGPSTTSAPTPPPVPISIPTATDGASPDGSGCTPPEGRHLPNGIWFGVLKTVDAAAGTIGLDLACWFSGTSAQAITGSTGPVDNDHYVRNQNPRIYTLPAVPNVAVVPLAQAANGEFTGGPGAAASGLSRAQPLLADQSNHYVWVEITDGLVTVVQAQFSP